ncbi:hypothetical protein MBLNU459_g3780t1 [Dothideomycetes sp. NU459]
MRFPSAPLRSLLLLLLPAAAALPASPQIPLLRHAALDTSVSAELFADLEELARVVDISYCVGLTGAGIQKPFTCLSRCADFPDFELVKTWNTGQLMADSCGYVAISHAPSSPRIIVAFRGTYSVANTVVDLSTVPQEYAPYPGDPGGASGDQPRCNNCTVHSGFFTSWNVTASAIMPDLEAAIAAFPDYSLTLVGHSLGGAVAALAGLDFISRGWHPTVTTFGEPRLGNRALMEYVDRCFDMKGSLEQPVKSVQTYEQNLRYRRVTHIDDPVPLLPLSEWGYRMHAGEIYITKSSLSPDIQDLQHCVGDEDPQCIAGQDGSLAQPALSKRSEVRNNVRDLVQEAAAWGPNSGTWMPSRYKLWQLFFAHRDYFWRLGLCVPGGDPWDWGRQPYGPAIEDDMAPIDQSS